jgi:hypothetical protein
MSCVTYNMSQQPAAPRSGDVTAGVWHVLIESSVVFAVCCQNDQQSSRPQRLCSADCSICALMPYSQTCLLPLHSE